MSTLFDLEQICKDLEEGAKRLGDKLHQVDNLVGKLRDNETSTAADASCALWFVREAYEKIDAQRKVLYHTKDFLEKSIVPDRMEKEGTDMVRIPSLARSFSLQQKMGASFVNKQAGFDWLREIGQGDIIQETVNASTLSAFCRNMILEEGLEPPADVVKVTTYNTVGISKYTPKERA